MTRRILHVLAPAPFGGLERVVQALATAQRARGDQVFAATIIEHSKPEPEILASLRRGGVTVQEVALPARAYPAQVRALRAICNDLRSDVIHSHGYVADVFVGLSREHLPSALATTVHGFTGGSRKNRLYEWMQRRALRRFDAVVAVSAKLGRELVAQGVPADLVHTIPNAYPDPGPLMEAAKARRTLAIPEGSFSIGWVGRVSREKGLDVLIEALPALHGLDWHLTVVGDGRERNGIRLRAAQLGLLDRISWAGAVVNAAELVRAFDLLVISSRTEGTPMILFEAMAGAVPIVTTAVGGIPDVVSPQDAVLVPSGDPDALAMGILASHRDLRAATQRADRALGRLRRDFTMDALLSRYDAVYDDIQSRTRTTGS